jgi:beta-galactosidase/beta-glucuronidase
MPARVQAEDAEILRGEIPGWGYFGDGGWQEAAYQDVHDMIVRDRNHPSVVGWGSMPNEAGEHVAEYTLYIHASRDYAGQDGAGRHAADRRHHPDS